MVSHPSSRVPDTCRIYAKVHWSCSGSWGSNTLLRHFMLVIPLVWQFHVNIYIYINNGVRSIHCISIYCILNMSLHYIAKLSKKDNVLSLSTCVYFQQSLCVNICMKITRFNNWDKLNKFHRHVTNRNWIMCPWTKGGVKIKSNSQFFVWPPAALSSTVHLLIDCTRLTSSCCEMLPHSSTKAPASSQTFLGGMALALTLRSNRSQTCSMGLRSRLFAVHGRTLTFLSCRKSRTEQAVWLVALSCWRVMSVWACMKGTTWGRRMSSL